MNQYACHYCRQSSHPAGPDRLYPGAVTRIEASSADTTYEAAGERSGRIARRDTTHFFHRPHARTGPAEAADSSGHLLSRRGLPDGQR